VDTGGKKANAQHLFLRKTCIWNVICSLVWTKEQTVWRTATNV